MNPRIDRSRQPAGIPTGGEFATSARGEATIDLTPKMSRADLLAHRDEDTTYGEYVDSSTPPGTFAITAKTNDRVVSYLLHGEVGDDDATIIGRFDIDAGVGYKGSGTLGGAYHGHGTQDEIFASLIPKKEYVGTDAAGVRLLPGDVLLKSGANQWTAAKWTVVERAGDKVLIESDTGRRMRASTSTYDIVRPDPEMPTGYSAHLNGVDEIEALRDERADRDPAYAQKLQDVIDDLPMRAVGSFYRDRMAALPPEKRREVAQAPYELYFSLSAPHNGWSHEDALTAAKGNSEIRDRPKTNAEYEAMDDEELRKHYLTWEIRPDDETRARVSAIAAQRGIDIRRNRA